MILQPVCMKADIYCLKIVRITYFQRISHLCKSADRLFCVMFYSTSSVYFPSHAVMMLISVLQKILTYLFRIVFLCSWCGVHIYINLSPASTPRLCWGNSFPESLVVPYSKFLATPM